MQHLELNSASIEKSVAAWALSRPGEGMLVLLPEAGTSLVPQLQGLCRQHHIALCGGIFPAIVSAGDFVSDSGWILPLPAHSAIFLVDALADAPVPAVDQLFGQIRDHLQALPVSDVKPVLMLLFDGLLPNVTSLLDRLYLKLANRVVYVGANAGNERFEVAPCLFDGERLLSGGMLALVLQEQAAPALGHGYVAPENALSATSTAGNRIASIDWRPAFEVYGELVSREYGVALTAENFYQYGVHFPFGILQANGDIVLRIPVGLTEDGALLCVGEVPENSLLVVVRAPQADVNGCVSQLADDLYRQEGSVLGRNLLLFYCAGRRMHLGLSARDELSALAARTEAACIGGALSIGEIGSLRRGGYPMFHNASLVAMPWASS